MTLEEILLAGVASGLPIISSIAGYVYKKHHDRLNNLEFKIDKHTISLEKKLDREQVREIIDDKVQGICIRLDEIKEDIRDIKTDLKRK